MAIYIGAENIISPLGNTAEKNFDALRRNITAIKPSQKKAPSGEIIHLSAFDATTNFSFDVLVNNCLSSMRESMSKDIFSSDRVLLILSTTKGDLNRHTHDVIGKAVASIQTNFSFQHTPIVVSNACTSGVIAINTGANLINAKLYDHVIVLGCDIISDFVVNGFLSLFAISKTGGCAPYDKNRTGITLGEACAGVVLSNDRSVFKQAPMLFVEGTSSNDANHISGPSRTGEGLYRTIKKTLELSGVNGEEIDFISAHGTATMYNDDMESEAFDRLKMNAIPLNSFKGYFGHTLGAAGVIETAMCIQCMRHDTLIKSYGFKEVGTPKKINVINENKIKKINTILKTASGFGGSNASLILKKP